MRVLGICGSLRRGSYNRMLLAAAAKELPSGATLEVFDDLAMIPPYSEDLDTGPGPAAVRRLRGRIAAAHAVLIATPEYNASIPGHLKNALDWASRPFPDNALRDKPVAVVGASTSLFGATWAQAELRRTLRTIGAVVIETELAVGRAPEVLTPDGRFSEPQLRTGLAGVVNELMQASLAASAS